MTATILIAAAALAVAIAAIVIAIKKSPAKEVVTTEKVVRVEYAPVEHPFIYDEEENLYLLKGDLAVTGALSAYGKNTDNLNEKKK